MSETTKKPAAAAPEVAVDAVPAGHVRVTNKESQLSHDIPQATWALLGEAGQKAFTQDVAKPADLK